jgi:CBS domain-containing protein
VVEDFMRPLVRLGAGHSLREAAAAMSAAQQSCAVVESPAGPAVVTDSDLRSAYGRGLLPDGLVASVANVPVRCVPRRTPVVQAFLAMVEHGVHHLVVTDDAGAPIGVVQAVDVALSEIRDPLLVRAAVGAASDVGELATASGLIPDTLQGLHGNAVAPIHIGAVLAALREALVLKALALSAGPSDARSVCWMVLGSLARGEPLPASDLDTALVWQDDDGAVDRGPGLRRWADEVLGIVERCGLVRCPDGANATNPLLSRSRSAWERAATTWVSAPTGDVALLLTAMLADSRPITEPALGREVTQVMLAAIDRRRLLPMFLRLTVAARPPTGLLRTFVVEHSGDRRGHLDLKRIGLLPVVALGRWVTVVTGDDRGGTVERLRRGAEHGVFTADERDVLTAAFELFYGLLLDRELSALGSGQPCTTDLAPAELDSLTRRYLRDAFREVARVQRRMEGEWLPRFE